MVGRLCSPKAGKGGHVKFIEFTQTLNAPVGLARRSEGLATRIPPRTPHFAVFSAFPPPDWHNPPKKAIPAAEKQKKRRTAIGGRPVVANPSLRWGKPNGGGKSARLLGYGQVGLIGGLKSTLRERRTKVHPTNVRHTYACGPLSFPLGSVQSNPMAMADRSAGQASGNNFWKPDCENNLMDAAL